VGGSLQMSIGGSVLVSVKELSMIRRPEGTPFCIFRFAEAVQFIVQSAVFEIGFDV